MGFRDYIHSNPVKRGLVSGPNGWPYSSASGKFSLDEVSQRLKPGSFDDVLLQRWKRCSTQERTSGRVELAISYHTWQELARAIA